MLDIKAEWDQVGNILERSGDWDMLGERSQEAIGRFDDALLEYTRQVENIKDLCVRHFKALRTVPEEKQMLKGFIINQHMSLGPDSNRLDESYIDGYNDAINTILTFIK